MTNNKFYVINNVAARIYEEFNKISIEWFIKSDPEENIFYKMDNPLEFQNMSLYSQNAAIQLQMKIDKDFFGMEQSNRYN